MKVWTRCRRCLTRRVLKQHPDYYQIVPRCRCCGARDFRVVKKHRQVTCNCEGWWFPHRKGSKHCFYNTERFEEHNMISIVADTETTGLLLPKSAGLEKQPRVIELCLVRLEGSTIVSEHNWLINPEQEITAEITKITGIKNEDLVGKPLFRELLAEIEPILAGADFFIAHNAHFDRTMIKNEFARCERTGYPWPAKNVCTVQEFRHEFGKFPKLVDLYERKLGRPLAQTHRALDDVKALIEVLQHEQFFTTLEMA